MLTQTKSSMQSVVQHALQDMDMLTACVERYKPR